MNRMTLAFALLAGIAAVPATALAMEPYLPRTQKAFTKADADHNGQVSAAELTPLAERRFDRMDTDKDGSVTPAEIDAALKRALEARRARMMAALDADKDGKVTRAELDALVASLVAAADSDKDGGVSLEEIRKYRLAKIARPATGGSSN